jgi:hypothetical protein
MSERTDQPDAVSSQRPAGVRPGLRTRIATAPASTRLRSLVLRVRAAYEFDCGRVGVPAERAKRRHLLGLASEGGHRTFVESGTYLGGTVEFMLPYVDRVVSVEVDKLLYERARNRFAAEPKAEMVLGDSLEEIPRIVSQLADPPLVWLDGHFSYGITGMGEQMEPSPDILRRMRAQGLPSGSTIAIDDVHLFGTMEGFPPLEALVDSVRETFPDGRLSVGMDALVIRA